MACKLHRIRYYNPKPEAINCVSFNKISKLLAVARGDASIEIWDLNYAPYLIKSIPGSENTSVEALGWVKHRLLSTGLGGNLLEWDLDTLTVKATIILTGYAAWCLDVNPTNTLVAVGTEQGYVNLYTVENDEIIYKKLFDKQDGRIMCCKFNKSGTLLVTGSVDTIRVWNVETGHATCRISVSRRGHETIVWCLAVLSDNTVVSGDSFGRLTFWDTNTGDQIESYFTHKSNILSIVISDDEKSLYCSGVDPVITNFVKVNTGSGNQDNIQWSKNIQRNIHEHDVRGLVLNGDKLISVGADGYITLSSYPPKWVMRVPPMIPAPRSSVCAPKKLLLLRYSNYLEVWRLGSYAINDKGDVTISNVQIKENVKIDGNNQLEQDSEIDVISKGDKNFGKKNQNLKVTEQPVKLAAIQTKGAKHIKCCELSPSGELIVYSTDSCIRMLKLEFDEDSSNVSLTKVLITGVISCDRVAFTADSKTMLTYKNGEVKVLQVDPDASATVVQTISCEKHFKSKCILHLQVSRDTPSKIIYLVVADTFGDIAVWIKKSKKFEFYVSLPKYRCVPSALTIDNKLENLIVAYVDQKIIEYELQNKKVSKWSGVACSEWRSRSSPVTALSNHPTRAALLCQDDASLWILDRDWQADEDEPAPKKKNKQYKHSTNMGVRIIPIKGSLDNDFESSRIINKTAAILVQADIELSVRFLREAQMSIMSTIGSFGGQKYLAGFHWLGKDEAVTLEILPENIVSQLPPVLASKRRNM